MSKINHQIKAVSAFAPATCANVAVGFDILGFAYEGIGDNVTLTRREDKKILITGINATDHLPIKPQKNIASAVIAKLSEDLQLDTGFSLEINKGIPLSSGMGGSAASAVAALAAINAFLLEPLAKEELIQYAVYGETIAAGGQGHLDNVVPCLYGGLTLIYQLNPLKIIQLPSPDLFCVLVHPHLRVMTKQARKILKPQLPMSTFIKQSSNLAAVIAALYRNDVKLLQETLHDVLIEPQRASLVPGFYQVKTAALDAGALTTSFSGSGPSLFAFAQTFEAAQKIGPTMCESFNTQGIDADYWISRISHQGAHTTEIITNDAHSLFRK